MHTTGEVNMQCGCTAQSKASAADAQRMAKLAGRASNPRVLQEPQRTCCGRILPGGGGGGDGGGCNGAGFGGSGGLGGGGASAAAARRPHEHRGTAGQGLYWRPDLKAYCRPVWLRRRRRCMHTCALGLSVFGSQHIWSVLNRSTHHIRDKQQVTK